MTRRPPFEPRPGSKVRFGPDGSVGELIRSSPNGEEWLVKNRLGRFWVSTMRLNPADEEAAAH
ncbi:MAG: hypothetical protein E6H84_08410 [Chloroflexi bacterium]|nr:MAG: hypothetical protein E6H84_08410 [Chloroflexota bacterium]TMG71456.1 MAG: hypothetical protein E6H81_03515 [Chloroflexota bacterium]